MIKFACPGCEAVFTVGDEKAGKTGKCPKCSAQFLIPDAEPPAFDAAPAPSPIPPPPAEDAAVEIKPCPGCQAKLTVAVGDLGLDVECPYCKAVYKAAKPGGSVANIAVDDRPKRSSRRESDDDDDRPSRKSRRDRYDDDDDDDRPRSKRRRRSYEPHRGGLILTFGILALLMCGLIFGPLAWFMGSKDLKEMDAGRMDPEGRGLTQAGRIIGIISFILNLLGFLFYCVVFGFVMANGGAGRGR